MAYGDSANWIGTVPLASPPTEFVIEFKCEFKGPQQELGCTFYVKSHQTEHKVAPAHCKRWNEENGGGACNEGKKPNRYHRVWFDGEVDKMWVKGYPRNTPPPSNFTLVEFGEKTEAIKDHGGLYVFNA